MTDETTTQLDLSQYSTAHGAANALAKYLRSIASDPDEVVVFDPDETRAKRNMVGDVDLYTVSWEGGPYQWATALTGGESLYANATGRYGTPPQVTGFYGDDWGVECHYSFDIQFYNK